MCRFTVLTLSFLIYEQTVFAATVDQRQTGDFNVQIDLKNFQIVGLMKGKEEYVDYDYTYDYSELTIKPPNGTTKKPLNVTDTVSSDKDNTTVVVTTVSAELDQTTSSIENSLIINETVITTTPSKISTTTIDVTIPPSQQSADNIITTARESADIITTTASSNCKKGFFRNSNGNCEFKLQNPSNALLKMIRQKSKLSGSNGVRKL